MLPTYQEMLQAAIARLGESSDSPRLDAEVLLAHALGKPRSHIAAWPERQATAEQAQAFEKLLARRLGGEPVAHILGEREFWSLPLAVTPHTLIPRPDTEILVEAALERIPEDAACKVLDLGTGTGAIALAISKERPRAQVCAVDNSLEAVKVARANAQALHLDVDIRHGHWWQPFADVRFDVIVSNPPYIPASDPHLAQGDVRFEPEGALFAGADGLDAIREIVAGTPPLLVPGGWLLLEHGYDQATPVAELLARAGYTGIGCRRDLAGRDRVSFGRRG